MNRSAPLRRFTALKSKTPLKRTAWKRTIKREDPELTRSKKLIRRRSRGICEIERLPVCTHWASQAHHILRRSQHVDHSPENLLDSCGPCHRWVHENPEQARQLGYLKSGHKKFGSR